MFGNRAAANCLRHGRRPGLWRSPRGVLSPTASVSSKPALPAQLSISIDAKSSVLVRSPCGENGKHGEIIDRNRQNLPHLESGRSVRIKTIATGHGAQAIRPQLLQLTDFQRLFVYTIPAGEAGNWYYAVNHFEVTLRSRAGVQTADVTPQRTTTFKVTPGGSVTWQNINVFTAQVLQSGTVTADSAGLVTIPGVQILTGTGNRLVLNAGYFPPIVQAPIGATQLQAPTITCSASHGAASYDVWISNLSTGQNR